MTPSLYFPFFSFLFLSFPFSLSFFLFICLSFSFDTPGSILPHPPCYCHGHSSYTVSCLGKGILILFSLDSPHLVPCVISTGWWVALTKDIFWELVMEFSVCIYLDDIFIFSKTLSEHWSTVWRVLSLLWDHQLYLQPDKFEFKKTTIGYIRLIISKENTIFQIHILLLEVHPSLLPPCSAPPWPHQEGENLELGENMQYAFDKLKGIITSAPTNTDVFRWLLHVPGWSEFFRLCNQSNHLAAVPRWWQIAPNCLFLQEPESSGRKLWDTWQGDAGHHMCPRRMETLSSWRSWTPVQDLDISQEPWVVLDFQELNQRQARWSLYPSWFRFTFHHYPGKTMGEIDALSWRPDHGSGVLDNSYMILLQPELFPIECLTSKGKSITPWHPDHQTFMEMEDTGTGSYELLVATDFQVHRTVYEGLKLVPLNKSTETASNGGVSPTPSPGAPMGHPSS